MPISNGVPYIGGPVMGATAGSILFSSSTNTLGQSNTNLFWDNSNNRLGIITASPTNTLSFGGEAARKIWMERRTTSNVAGNNFTFEAGGATSGATNKAGGKLILSSGIATGTGQSSVEIWTAAAGGTGTTDRTPSAKVTVAGTGALTLNSSSTAAGGYTAFTQSVTGGALNAGSVVGQSWSFTTTSQIDSSIGGLVLQLGSTVIAGDTGGSYAQGFGFEIYLNTDGVGTTHPGGTAVGGFLQASGPGPTGPLQVYLAQCNIIKACDSFTGFVSAPNFLDTGITLTTYTGLHVGNFGSMGGTITNSYGVKIEDLSIDNANAYALHSSGGKTVHAGKFRIGDTTDPSYQLQIAGDSQLGSTTAHKCGFMGTAPITRPSGAAQALVATTAATNIAPYGYTTASQTDGIITLLNEVRNVLVNLGLMKGSA